MMDIVTGQIRKIEVNDLGAIVDVHLRSFDGFFLTFLGRNFLYELYAGILSDASGVGYVFDDRGRILGFVAGASQPSGFYRRLITKRWWRFGLASILPLIRNPAILPRLLRVFSKLSNTINGENCGELMSLAVLPNSQRKGVGQLLVSAFLQDLARSGIKSVILTTDRYGNDGANNFYQNLGFTCVRKFSTPEGREMIEYQFVFPSVLD